MDRVGKTESAIKAYKRALVAGSYVDGIAGFVTAADGSQQQVPLGGGVLDPDVLFQIALLYEKLGDQDETAAYMEMVLAQEEGPSDSDGQQAGVGVDAGAAAAQTGVGVTPTTSKARMWLAKWEFLRQNFQRSMELANELCQDGVEVEEAKALVRDIRARIESSGDGVGTGAGARAGARAGES